MPVCGAPFSYVMRVCSKMMHKFLIQTKKEMNEDSDNIFPNYALTATVILTIKILCVLISKKF